MTAARLSQIARRVEAAAADLRSAEDRLAEEREASARAREAEGAAEQAREAAQAIAEEVQRKAHARISRAATACLEAVFGEDSYELRIEFERKRGRTEARAVLVDSEGHELSPMGAVGGGVVDVVSLALRLTALRLARPARRQLLVLDEPLKHLSRDRRPAARELIRQIAEEDGVQVILVTHQPELELGQVVRLGGE